jgi:uncharacterized protein
LTTSTSSIPGVDEDIQVRRWWDSRALGLGRSEHHAASLELLETHVGPLIVPTLVITEVTYLLGSRLGADAEVRFLGDLAAGNLLAESVAASDWMRIAELVATYRDLPLGTADASVIAAAERLGIRDIATLDRRHFTVVRSRLGDLTLLP